jgi:hypothetical protein
MRHAVEPIHVVMSTALPTKGPWRPGVGA